MHLRHVVEVVRDRSTHCLGGVVAEAVEQFQTGTRIA
jgi:hypothetical protein